MNYDAYLSRQWDDHCDAQDDFDFKQHLEFLRSNICDLEEALVTLRRLDLPFPAGETTLQEWMDELSRFEF